MSTSSSPLTTLVTGGSVTDTREETNHVCKFTTFAREHDYFQKSQRPYSEFVTEIASHKDDQPCQKMCTPSDIERLGFGTVGKCHEVIQGMFSDVVIASREGNFKSVVDALHSTCCGPNPDERCFRSEMTCAVTKPPSLPQPEVVLAPAPAPAVCPALPDDLSAIDMDSLLPCQWHQLHRQHESKVVAEQTKRDKRYDEARKGVHDVDDKPSSSSATAADFIPDGGSNGTFVTEERVDNSGSTVGTSTDMRAAMKAVKRSVDQFATAFDEYTNESKEQGNTTEPLLGHLRR